MSTIYGLTGGIGMGKSTVASVLAKARLPVVDSDELAREVVQPGQPAPGRDLTSGDLLLHVSNPQLHDRHPPQEARPER